jgi:DDE superfamily endonuclease
VFIEFLKRLLSGATQKIFLIVDRDPAHRAKKTKAFVKSLGGALQLFFLPPYPPDLNPDELMWNHCAAYPRKLGWQIHCAACRIRHENGILCEPIQCLHEQLPEVTTRNSRGYRRSTFPFGPVIIYPGSSSAAHAKKSVSARRGDERDFLAHKTTLFGLLSSAAQ